MKEELVTSPYAGLVGDAPAAGDSTFASPDAFGTTDGSPSACACVLAAGQGTRMKSDKAKVLHEVLGAPLLAHVLDACAAAGVARAIAVVGHQRETVEGAFAGREGLSFALQADQRGTGHAVLCAREAWVAAGKPATLLVLCGDAPLQRPSTLRALLQEQEQAGNAATLLTAKVEDPTGYGRIVRAPEGGVAAIVEQRDASEAQRAIREINSGTYVFDAVLLFEALEALCGRELAARADGKKAEHYLTDVVAAFVSAGRPVGAVIAGDAVEILGINDRRQLLNAQRLLHERRMIDLLEAGVVIPQPDKVVIEHGATVGAGTVIHPFTVIRRGVVVGEDCEVGPFAHLGPKSELDQGAAIGNFVEVKRTHVGAGAKAKHLAYLGDGQIGPRANIGAGTVFCNYDGKHKHTTHLGERAFVGSGSMLVAPVTIEAGGRTGAGAVVKGGTTIQQGETWVGVPARRVGPVRPDSVAESNVHEGGTSAGASAPTHNGKGTL